MILKRDKRTSRSILTTEGWITYRRYRLYAINDDDHPDSISKCIEYYGSPSVYPLDIYMGIDKLPFKITVNMALRIAKIGASSSSYQEASNRFLEDFDIRISDDYIREVVDYIGDIILEEDKSLTVKAINSYDPKKARWAKPGRKPKNGFVLYCEADGAMFNTRKNLRTGKDGNNKDTGSSWKENKLGVVFRSDSLIKTNESDDYGNPVFRLGDREYICTTQGVDVFRERLVYLMIRNGLSDASDVVLISDGATWISRTREKYFPEATQILDLFHLKENVMSFGQYIYSNDKSKYYPWWKEVCKLLENGKWKAVLQRPEITVYNKEKDTPKGIVNLYHYIYDRRDIINYPKYREKGYFVGSGAIESGNKTVLQERLKLSGMQWYIESAETLLALRAKLKSNLWSDYVEPLIIREYAFRHKEKGSVRDEQRKQHSKNSGCTSEK